MTEQRRTELAELISQLSTRLDLPMPRSRAEDADRALGECAGQLVTLLKNLREDLAWALEYADELAAAAMSATAV